MCVFTFGVHLLFLLFCSADGGTLYLDERKYVRRAQKLPPQVLNYVFEFKGKKNQQALDIDGPYNSDAARFLFLVNEPDVQRAISFLKAESGSELVGDQADACVQAWLTSKPTKGTVDGSPESGEENILYLGRIKKPENYGGNLILLWYPTGGLIAGTQPRVTMRVFKFGINKLQAAITDGLVRPLGPWKQPTTASPVTRVTHTSNVGGVLVSEVKDGFGSNATSLPKVG